MQIFGGAWRSIRRPGVPTGRPQRVDVGTTYKAPAAAPVTQASGGSAICRATSQATAAAAPAQAVGGPSAWAIARGAHPGLAQDEGVERQGPARPPHGLGHARSGDPVAPHDQGHDQADKPRDVPDAAGSGPGTRKSAAGLKQDPVAPRMRRPTRAAAKPVPERVTTRGDRPRQQEQAG